MSIFVTADMHFGEDRLTIMGRPFSSTEKMEEEIISKHNSLVSKKDTIVIVGDICYKNTPEKISLLKKLNGRKVLIRGNHDEVFSLSDLNHFFDSIIPDGDGMEITAGGIPCYITHYPTRGRKDRFNIVGHCHAAWKYQLNMFNIGVDANHFFPVNLETIPSHLKAITEFYDEDVWVAYKDINADYRSSRGKKSTYFKGE